MTHTTHNEFGHSWQLMISEGSFSAAKVFVREMQKFRNVSNSQNFSEERKWFP